MEEEWNNLDNQELKGLFRKHLLRGALFMIALIIFIFVIALSFEPQIKVAADWLTFKFGFWGLALIVFLSDMIISPIPPDAALFFIGKSYLHEQWYFYVPFLGLVSSLAGVMGWLIGGRLQHLKVVKVWISSFVKEHHDSVRRFGFWMVVLGALTPLPFSITCWVAGIFQLEFKRFFIASLFRIPRFVLFYWAIFYSGEIGTFLRSIL